MQNKEVFLQLIKSALAEDIGAGDVTAQLIPPSEMLSVTVFTREKMVLCGAEYFNETFHQIDKHITTQWRYNDTDVINANSEICTVTGSARNILMAERTALNFLQTLSATATATHHLVQLIKHTSAKLLDTRKTIPGLRHAQKYAVKCGGAINHRMGLYDAFLIKENHIRAMGSITAAVKQARLLNPRILLEVEVENLVELEEALANNTPRVLLDNFKLADLKKAVKITASCAELEASGNISEKNIVEIAEAGVDFISVGQITKNIKAIDLAMRFIS